MYLKRKKNLTFIVNNFPKLSLLLHGGLFLQVPMIRDIRDIFRILAQPKGLWIISYLRDFALLLFELCMVLYVRLDFCILSYSLQFWRFGNCRCFGFRYVSANGKKNLLTFFSIQIYCHVGRFSFEMNTIHH